nr:MAG: peptide deformylase [Bacillota bacterium]
MAILPIVTHPHPVLRKKAKPVQKINASIRKLIDDMTETMYAAPGVGLAAPQVGVSKRIIVVDAQDGSGLFQVINPEIVAAEDFGVMGTEGCLSIPGLVGDVPRYRKVRVTGLNRDGHRIWIDAEGWLARIFQHEIDHLDGILYIDKATNIREVKEEEEEAPEAGEAGEATEAAKAGETGEARAAGGVEAARAGAGASRTGTGAGGPQTGARGAGTSPEAEAGGGE